MINPLDPGPIMAVPTPFDVSGAVDEASLAVHCKLVFDKGCPNIVAGGTTAEFASLTMTERKRVTEVCVKSFGGKVIGHVSATSVQEAVSLCDHAQAAGCHAILLLPPYYFHDMEDEGILRFLSSVLVSCSLPCFLYNFPKHVGNVISPYVYTSLAQAFPSCLVGIKDSCSVESAEVLRKAWPAGVVYVGNDGEALNILNRGMEIISGACNPCPELLMKLYFTWKAGDVENAKKVQGQINEWLQVKSAVKEIPALKVAINQRIENYGTSCRAPFVTVKEGGSESVGARIREWVNSNLSK